MEVERFGHIIIDGARHEYDVSAATVKKLCDDGRDVKIVGQANRDAIRRQEENAWRSSDTTPRPYLHFRKRDTSANRRARQERAIDEAIEERLYSLDIVAHRATKSELTTLGYSSGAIVLILNDGRTVKLKTNWTESRPEPRFPLNTEPKEPDIRRFDIILFALVDDNANVPIVWWPVPPKELRPHWHLSDDDGCGYVNAVDLLAYKNNWDAFTE